MRRPPLIAETMTINLVRRHESAAGVNLSEYIVLFVLVLIMGGGVPGPGDAALIATGTLAGEDRLNVGVVHATAMSAWLLGSGGSYEIRARAAPRVTCLLPRWVCAGCGGVLLPPRAAPLRRPGRGV